MTKRSTKRALLLSALSLLLCVSMLVGSTYAWFTDSVTSSGNIIQAGKLEVEMNWADGETDPAGTTWTDASKGAIFNSALWEPGYTEARHIQIVNAGNLAFNYKLRIVANGTVSKLADVIDVYYFATAKQLDRTTVEQGQYLGTVTEVLGTDKNIANTIAGFLKAGDSTEISLALKMQESAGNEYQGMALAADFSVELIATQATYEEDSFDKTYDENALSAAIPAALVRELEDKNITATIGIGGEAEELTLNTGYKFQPTQSYDELLKSEYKYYLADFIVSADKDVPAGSIALAGYYHEWCQYNGNNWVAMVNDGLDVTAGTEIALVEALGANVHYIDICRYGNDGIGFLCGVADLTGENAGTTITVQLCLYETTADPNGSSASTEKVDGVQPIVIGEFKYTFPEAENNGFVVTDAASLKTALANGEKEIAVSGVIDLTESLAATDVTFTGAGDNAGIDFNGHNIGGSGTVTYNNLNLTTVALGNEAGERAGFHGGIDYVGHTTANYVDCTITGVFSTYSDIVNATRCTFNYYVQDGEEYYGMFLYDSGAVNAEDCIFMYGDRAIKIYSEGAATYELNIKGGAFKATDNYTLNKALINVDSTYFASAKITVEGVEIDEKLAGVKLHNAAGDSKVTVSWN